MSIWQSSQEVSLPLLQASLLSYRQSMTQYLREQCNNTLRVEVLKHEWGVVMADDSEYLGLSAGESIIEREVFLHCYDKPWLYAKTVLPKKLVECYGDELVVLGARPIGEILFADSRMTRSEFEFAKLTEGNPILEKINTWVLVNHSELWARRSIFSLPDKGQLAITEVFLPICWTS